MITPAKCMVMFREQLKELYQAYGIHLKHTKHDQPEIDRAAENIGQVHSYLLGIEDINRAKSDIPTRGLMWQDGSVATTSRKTIHTLSEELKYMSSHIKEATGKDPNQVVNLQCCNTNDVENNHSLVHHKTDTPTILHYAKD